MGSDYDELTEKEMQLIQRSLQRLIGEAEDDLNNMRTAYRKLTTKLAALRGDMSKSEYVER